MTFTKKQRFFLMTISIIVTGIGFLTIHARTQATILGYELGHLKKKEKLLLKKKSLLTAKVAKATIKKNLLSQLNNKNTK